MGGGMSVPVIRLNHPGLRVQLQANSTSYSRIQLRPSDTQRLREAEQRNRVCVDIHVRVVEGSITGAFLAVKSTTRSDATVAPYGPLSPQPHPNFSHPTHASRASHRSAHLLPPPPLPVSPHETTPVRQDYLAQHHTSPAPNGDVHLRLLPRHTANFAPASYFLTVVSGPLPGVIDVTASLQLLPYPHPPSAVYFHQLHYPLDPYASDRLRVLSDDAYIEQLQWRVVDLERELGQSNCEVLESASSLRLQRQNAALLIQLDDLRQQLSDAAHQVQGPRRTEEERQLLLQMEAQVEQYRAAARAARASIQELNHRVEEQAAQLHALRGHPNPHPHPVDPHHPHAGTHPAGHVDHRSVSHPTPHYDERGHQAAGHNHAPLHPSQYPDAHRPAADRRLSPLPRGRPHTAGQLSGHREEVEREDGRRVASHSPAVVRGSRRRNSDGDEEPEFEVHHPHHYDRQGRRDEEADGADDDAPHRNARHPHAHRAEKEPETSVHRAHAAAKEEKREGAGHNGQSVKGDEQHGASLHSHATHSGHASLQQHETANKRRTPENGHQLSNQHTETEREREREAEADAEKERHRQQPHSSPDHATHGRAHTEKAAHHSLHSPEAQHHAHTAKESDHHSHHLSHSHKEKEREREKEEGRERREREAEREAEKAADGPASHHPHSHSTKPQDSEKQQHGGEAHHHSHKHEEAGHHHHSTHKEHKEEHTSASHHSSHSTKEKERERERGEEQRREREEQRERAKEKERLKEREREREKDKDREREEHRDERPSSTHKGDDKASHSGSHQSHKPSHKDEEDRATRHSHDSHKADSTFHAKADSSHTDKQHSASGSHDSHKAHHDTHKSHHRDADASTSHSTHKASHDKEGHSHGSHDSQPHHSSHHGKEREEEKTNDSPSKPHSEAVKATGHHSTGRKLAPLTSSHKKRREEDEEETRKEPHHSHGHESHKAHHHSNKRSESEMEL